MSKVFLSDLSKQLQSLLEVDKNYTAGFALGRHILRYWPHHLQTYARLGIGALAVGLYADAADVLRRALSADPEAGALWAGLRQAAAALGEEGETTIARQYEQDILGHTPDSDPDPYAQAAKATAQGNWQRALRIYQRLYGEHPARMDIALGYARALYELGRIDASLAVTQQILDELPYCLKAHWLIIRCAHATSLRSIDVLDHLKTIESLDPDYSYAQRWFPDLTPPSSPPMLPLWKPSERWLFD